MRTTAPALLPIFRSDVQARLLALVFARPEEPQSVSELARRLRAHVATVQREVDRLEEAGILESRREGRSRLVRQGSAATYLPELRALILRVFGPARVIEDALRPIAGIREAYLFGSWAERYLGRPGPPPADVDVLVVGDPDREQVYAAAAEAERAFALPVDVVIRTPNGWAEGEDAFARTIRKGPLVRLDVEAA